jgi:small subunit ribosomal protein S13
MVYLFETKINPNLKSTVALSQVFGIGRSSALKILGELGIQEKATIGSFSKTHLLKLRKIIDKNFSVSSRLKQQRIISINNLIKIRSYRGSRHRNKLPVRGQRSSTNARTQKNRKN